MTRLRQYLKNKMIWVGGVILLGIILVALLADFITTFDPSSQNFSSQLVGPGERGHPLGTDEYGRDLWSRIVYGTRVSIEVGFFSTCIGLVLGCLLGAFGGYFGARTDMIVGRVMDVLMAFPSLIIAILILAVLGPSLRNAMIAVGITMIPRFYRVVRASTLVIRERGFVLAAVALGRSDIGIIARHVIPNVLSPILVTASLACGRAILTEAELSFLGLGAQPPTPSWGSIISGGRMYLDSAPWIIGFAGLAIMVMILGLNLLGDGLRDVLDPKLKT